MKKVVTICKLVNLTPIAIFLSLLLTALLPLAAQDFGFGSEDTGGSFSLGTENTLSVLISGEVSAAMTGFFDDFSDGAEATRLGDIFSGKLNFTTDTSIATGIINLKLQTSTQPVAIDEAYLCVYFGKFDIEGGLRKLSWGKADSMGPLDVINPLDYSDLSNFGDRTNMKIARPLIHASFHFGQFSKLEGIFVPNFEPVRFAESGRWAPAQFAALSQLPPGNIIRPDTKTLAYAQAGIRFTTTIMGMADVGLQYYYGRRTSPAVTQTLSPEPPPIPILTFAYNPYHQIGIDYAQVIAGFNLRAELAANITEDISGDDSAVFNPSLAWSLGFDRNLYWGITFNAQINETIRLLNNKINDPFDIEADSDITSTLIVAALSKKFMRDELELTTAILWDIESSACFIMPGLTWTKDVVSVGLSMGIFAGSDMGLFGQFHNNSFMKVGIKYTF